MLKLLHAITGFASSKNGSKAVIAFWLVLAVLLAVFAPSSDTFAVQSNRTDLPDGVPSEIARNAMETHFPGDGSLTALVVFHDAQPLTEEELGRIKEISRTLTEQKPEGVAQSVPLHAMPPTAWAGLFSEDRTTLMLPIRLDKELDSHQVHDVITELRVQLKDASGATMRVAVTGPAGIASDAIGIFKGADVVLMLATVALILVLLIVLYRSPVLAVVPLLIAAVLHQVTDRLLGIAGQQEWFVVESQALSIMMILLFAVLTDYCLFVFSRYREELRRTDSQYEAMRVAMTHVGEPIFFSSGIILVAVLALFGALFKPYQHFAPVFGVAMLVIMFGGLTLIPAAFSLIGRKAFWPFIPKAGEAVKEKRGFWNWLGKFVTRRPRLIIAVLAVLAVLLGGSSLAAGSIQYSFNLLQSFPKDMDSRAGFAILEQHFPKGTLAPVQVILESSQALPEGRLEETLSRLEGVASVSSEKEISSDQRAMLIELVLEDDPYEDSAMQTVQHLREQSRQLLSDSGYDPVNTLMHVAGQTATQLDTRSVNDRDTLWVMVSVTFLIFFFLIFQSRSLLAPLYMIGTILITYGATLGLSWLIFEGVFGYDAISYRIPVYSFVFIVALGVDYNILLWTRVREEAANRDLVTAIQLAVSKTGKTISSAGLILIATFAVLMTQPLLELFLFGFAVALGVLIDTFLVRGMLMPAIMIVLGRWNWWPGIRKQREIQRELIEEDFQNA